VTDDTTFLLREADTLASSLAAKATSLGLEPEAFFVPQVKQDIAHLRTLDFDSADVAPTDAMARLELNLSRAFMRCAVGLRYGFVDPHKAFNSLDPRDGGTFRQVYDIATERPSEKFLTESFDHVRDAMSYLNGLEPTDTIYQLLKQRLATDTTKLGRKRAICNMERRRWRHKDAPVGDYNSPSSRHIFVNIPSQQLWAVTSDSVFSMKICCGAWATKTPLLYSNVRLIQLNPEWRIPYPIMTAEVSPHAGDSSYFARHDYFILKNSTGDTINPKNITAEQLQQGGYSVAQHSGPRNALGRIIFRFPNKFDVYMHDTNNHRAFNAERRTLSHGCVRVERPFDLVKFLLPDADEWLLDRMRMTIDLPPESDKGKEYLEQREEERIANPLKQEAPIRFMASQSVSPTVPVMIDYYTLYPNPETGVWETWRDRYEYDDQIEKCLKRY
jgi:murein L,D-transpeptidase YcbB/YkuD